MSLRSRPGAPTRTTRWRASSRQFGRSVEAAQNVVVLHSELGSAPAVARALDRLEHPRIVGTIAGDDTIVAIARTNRDAALLAEELSELVG